MNILLGEIITKSILLGVGVILFVLISNEAFIYLYLFLFKMPIIDYYRLAKKTEAQLFSNPKISDANKKIIKKFLVIYDVSDARKDIFLRHIQFFLSRIDDANEAMKSRDIINSVFYDLRNKLSTNVYVTVVNVTKRLLRWLNDGSTPIGFKDIKPIPKAKLLRKLNTEDMVNWEDGLKMIAKTNSVQFKAIIATQLDGGFRPSEFSDLNLNDISFKKEFCVVHIRNGKTGPRNVILWRAVPYLIRWYQNHPGKKKDPLWVQEYGTKSNIKRCSYHSMVKRIKEIARKASIDKPFDFYNLRHSAYVIAKLDNIPEEEAAKKFGHSVSFYTNTYGRLTTEDSMERLSKVYGLEIKKKEVQKSVLCSKCEYVNEPESEFCEKCGSVLSVRKAIELQHEQDAVKHELTNVKEQLQDINSFMNEITKANPKIINYLADIAIKNKKKVS